MGITTLAYFQLYFEQNGQDDMVNGFRNRQEFLEALMELESLLTAPTGEASVVNAVRRDELAEAILRHEAIIENEPEWIYDT